MMIGEILDESRSLLAGTNCASHSCCDIEDVEGVDVMPLVLLLPSAGQESAVADTVVNGETHVEFHVGIGI